MKNILVIILLFLFLHTNAQEDKTVTLVVSGQGKTQEEAKLNAFRSAIEQAFGTFISSKTEILNNNLVKDEIVSVANGNIHKFEIISEVQLPDNSWASTLSAIVSINKLISYAENKGFEAELKGSLFAMNIIKDELYKQNEIQAVRNLCEVVRVIADKSFDWKIKVNSPIKFTPNQYSDNKDVKDLWEVPLSIEIITNLKFKTIPNLIYNTLASLNLKIEPKILFQGGKGSLKLSDGREVYPVTIAVSEEKIGYFILRSDSSQIALCELIQYFNKSILNFRIDNGLAKKSLDDIIIDRLPYIGAWRVVDKNDFHINIYDNFKILLAQFDNRYYEVSPLSLKNYTDIEEYNFKRPLVYSSVVISTYNKDQSLSKKFEFINKTKFYRSIPNTHNLAGIAIIGITLSFIGLEIDSNQIIRIDCGQILNLKDLGQIKSYKIVRTDN